jgi:transposase
MVNFSLMSFPLKTGQGFKVDFRFVVRHNRVLNGTLRVRRTVPFHDEGEAHMATRKRYDNQFKAQVALEATKNQRTISEIASDYGVHPNQVSKWKREALEGLPEIFSNKQKKQQRDNRALQDELYKQIGQLKVELDWLKKTGLLS